MSFPSLAHPASQALVVTVINRRSTSERQNSDLKEPPCEKVKQNSNHYGRVKNNIYFQQNTFKVRQPKNMILCSCNQQLPVIKLLALRKLREAEKFLTAATMLTSKCSTISHALDFFGWDIKAKTWSNSLPQLKELQVLLMQLF